MLIKTKKSWELTENDVTNEKLFNKRRNFIKAGGTALMASYIPTIAWAQATQFASQISQAPNTRTLDEELHSFEDITTHNNFYELGTGKTDPARYADSLDTNDWKIEVTGECGKPGTYALEDLIDFNSLEERIYRLRCVERWSMVIPWVGVSLSDILDKMEPNSNAKYVGFETLYDPDNPLPGQKGYPVLDWPYREGLRMDEAMHPLTMMAVGLYGKPMPNQNGAPLRLVVPWKYGFKSIKSIVKINFSRTQPQTSWNMSAASEYGFYSNVNPNVHHPRWSQASETRIGEWFSRDTLMFNGYADEVAHLYEGMDLSANY